MKEGIYHFWENVILPHTGNTDIENGVVSADLRGRKKNTALYNTPRVWIVPTKNLHKVMCQ